ncbi:MAG: hypothetical protein JNM75_08370 [Rhodospirillales bacterium]|nr:hypothetical protein [Rhodospirillales bacterium]
MNTEDVAYERDEPSCAVPLAASLELFGPSQGKGCFSRSPLEIEVSVGEQNLRNGEGFGFSLHFRRVIVALLFENCELMREGRYERTLPAEDFVQFLKRVVDTSRIAKGQVKAGTTKLLSSFLSTLGIELSAQANVVGSLERGDTKTIESKINFKIVRFVAGARWEIGHEILGDPTEIDNLLRGSYFNQPADVRNEAEYYPLCFVEPVGRRPYAVTIELRAKKADCVYVPLGNEPAGDPWERKNKEAIERLLALKMLKEQNQADALQCPEDEIILARARLSARTRRAQKPT